MIYLGAFQHRYICSENLQLKVTRPETGVIYHKLRRYDLDQQRLTEGQKFVQNSGKLESVQE